LAEPAVAVVDGGGCWICLLPLTCWWCLGPSCSSWGCSAAAAAGTTRDNPSTEESLGMAAVVCIYA
jgi:hypothetical protein